MQEILLELMNSVALLVVSALVMGLAFDRLVPGRSRDVVTGVIGGAAASLAMMGSHSVAGFQIDGRSAILLVTAFFGGPVGALVSLPAPLALRIDMGGAGLVPGVVGILMAAAIGTLFRPVVLRRKAMGRRRAVLGLALLSPLMTAGLFLALSSSDPPLWMRVFLALVAWLPFATAIFGLLVQNELNRADARHAALAKRRFLKATQMVGAEFLASQVEHHARLSERYNTHFAYMVISVDDGMRLHAQASTSAWFAMKSEIAAIVRDAVRESDVCGSMAFDRIGVLLPYTGIAAAYRVAQRISSTVADTVLLDGSPVTVSIGLAHVDEVTRPFDVAVAAEGALFIATATTPFGAIGPRPEQDPKVTESPRSFPGRLAA
ncbi:MAG: LytS/YhcK type 5TM receptor domain-containing protein [Pseudomonadota bacterium]